MLAAGQGHPPNLVRKGLDGVKSAGVISKGGKTIQTADYVFILGRRFSSHKLPKMLGSLVIACSRSLTSGIK